MTDRDIDTNKLRTLALLMLSAYHFMIDYAQGLVAVYPLMNIKLTSTDIMIIIENNNKFSEFN